jgi:uncharacterized membrane protein YhiD involved in acid resistance
MTLTLTAVALALLTGALLLEERSFRRRVARLRTPTTLRCLVCLGTPLVEDMATHTRLVHGKRVTAVEDSREWAS